MEGEAEFLVPALPEVDDESLTRKDLLVRSLQEFAFGSGFTEGLEILPESVPGFIPGGRHGFVPRAGSDGSPQEEGQGQGEGGSTDRASARTGRGG